MITLTCLLLFFANPFALVNFSHLDQLPRTKTLQILSLKLNLLWI